MRAILLISFLFCTALVEARMYQWVNPNTGSSQLSGKPPAWYRSEQGGPRVLVFENGNLVDDTSVLVTEEKRLELYHRAFDLPVTEEQKQVKRKEAVAKLEQQIKEIVESPEMALYLETPAPVVEEKTVEAVTAKPAQSMSITQPKTQAPAETPDERVSRLKALITAWESSQTESAKSIVESMEDSGEKKDAGASSETASENKPK